jgi:hypothetical protein
VLPTTLHNLAETFKISFENNHFDFFIKHRDLFYCGNFQNNTDQNEALFLFSSKRLQNYCLNSANVIFCFISILTQIFLSEQNLKLTNYLSISSLAFDIFKKKFNYLKVPLKIPVNLDIVLRESFFGGRTEVFANSNRLIYHYDFPGMYGLCMREKFPTALPK